MLLRYHPLSSYSRKVALAMDLRGDTIEKVAVDAFAGELKSEGVLSLNPFGKMPVLETDAGPIYESTSIIEYLEERGPRVLLPLEHERRCRHFDRLGDLYLLDAIGKFFWNKQEETKKTSFATLDRAWGVWEQELSDGRDFMCGEVITLADVGATIAAHYCITEEYPLSPAIQAYFSRLCTHPAVAASNEAAAPFVEFTRSMRYPAIE